LVNSFTRIYLDDVAKIGLDELSGIVIGVIELELSSIAFDSHNPVSNFGSPSLITVLTMVSDACDKLE